MILLKPQQADISILIRKLVLIWPLTPRDFADESCGKSKMLLKISYVRCSGKAGCRLLACTIPRAAHALHPSVNEMATTCRPKPPCQYFRSLLFVRRTTICSGRLIQHYSLVTVFVPYLVQMFRMSCDVKVTTGKL